MSSTATPDPNPRWRIQAQNQSLDPTGWNRPCTTRVAAGVFLVTNRNCTAVLPKELNSDSLTQWIDRGHGDPALWPTPSNGNHPHSPFDDINNKNHKKRRWCINMPSI